MSARKSGGLDPTRAHSRISAAAIPNWVVREATEADPRNDRVVLENPAVVASLDELLLTKYLPVVRAELEKTGHDYHPREAVPTIESATISGPQLARKLTFLLLDQLGFLFLRCSVSCDRTGYMVEKEFYLDLPESTDPKYLWRILGDERFAGNPPSLMVQRSVLHPEMGTYFWIKFEAGTGFQSGPWEMHGEGLADITQTIRNACEMYEQSMVEGFQSTDDVDRFLEIAKRSFEAS